MLNLILGLTLQTTGVDWISAATGKSLKAAGRSEQAGSSNTEEARNLQDERLEVIEKDEDLYNDV